MATDVRADPEATPPKAAGGCFCCGRRFRADFSEPVDGGEGVRLCRACGMIYLYPELCCG